MPYLQVNTNQSVTDELSQQLLQELSAVVVKSTGKPERYVMVQVNSGQTMCFGGSTAPLAYLECKSIGLSPLQAKALSAVLSEVLMTQLSLNADRIYIEFSNCPGEYWGWNKSTFA